MDSIVERLKDIAVIHTIYLSQNQSVELNQTQSIPQSSETKATLYDYVDIEVANLCKESLLNELNKFSVRIDMFIFITARLYVRNLLGLLTKSNSHQKPLKPHSKRSTLPSLYRNRELNMLKIKVNFKKSKQIQWLKPYYQLPVTMTRSKKLWSKKYTWIYVTNFQQPWSSEERGFWII